MDDRDWSANGNQRLGGAITPSSPLANARAAHSETGSDARLCGTPLRDSPNFRSRARGRAFPGEPQPRTPLATTP
jgi:hypothetical protein